MVMTFKGTKKVEIPYFKNQLTDNSKSVLIVGERSASDDDKISQNVADLNFEDVTTTDIRSKEPGSWLDTEVDWNHIECDFIKFDESLKFDYVIGISVFEHFGFWFGGERMADNLKKDECYWNHDLRGIRKSCKLLKDSESKLVITLPAGPYMNYLKTGEPFVRYYTQQRQQIVKQLVDKNDCKFVDEKFYLTQDFQSFNEVDSSICSPQNYNYINPYTPNLIWAFTIMQK